MPFFSLFFGIMFADMAYGTILLVLGLLITFKKSPRGRWDIWPGS
jgi:vacuolar-type H+-ATPase subunit I/STV1